MNRWFFKCLSCKNPWVVSLPSGASDSMLCAVANLECPLCVAPPRTHGFHRHKLMGKVEGKKLETTTILSPCDGRCTNAKGPNCDCLCKGENHGSNRTVEVKTLRNLPRWMSLMLETA